MVAEARLLNERATLAAKIAYAEQKLPDIQRPMSLGDVEAMEAVQRRADQIMTQFGKRAPVPRLGETPGAYHLRTVLAVAECAPRFKTAQLHGVTGPALDVLERQIYADAQAAAHHAAAGKPGLLVCSAGARSRWAADYQVYRRSDGVDVSVHV